MIDDLLNNLLKIEGGYVNDPNDAGGETNYGITVGVARRYGYLGAMKSMPLITAKEIYRKQYWLEPHFDRVAAVAPKVAAELFDTGVNMGINTAAFFLQRILTALNRGGTDYQDFKPTGTIGDITIDALTKFVKIRGVLAETILLRCLDALQGERYIALCERNPKNEKFLFGWIANRLDNVNA